MPLQTLEYDSDLMQRRVVLNVIVPDSAAQHSTAGNSAVGKPSRRYPVVYLYHGRGGDYASFARRTSINTLASQYEILLVMPDVGSDQWFCNDPRDGGLPWEDHLAGELVDEIDRRLPTIPERSARGLAGFSMGGYGAMLYGVKHPDRFAAIYGISGSYLFGHEIRTDRPERTPLMMAVAPPGGPNDLFRLSHGLLEAGHVPPAIRFCVGRDDHLLDSNRRLHEHFESIALAHRYEEPDGRHRWTFVDQQMPDVLDFMQEQLSDPR